MSTNDAQVGRDSPVWHSYDSGLVHRSWVAALLLAWLAVVGITLGGCRNKENTFGAADAEAWRSCSWVCTNEPSRWELHEGAGNWSLDRSVDEVVSALGSPDIPERDQIRYEGCPGCLIYALRMRWLSFDYLVLHAENGLVNDWSVQQRRFN